jgi:hypothetical protein
VLLLLARAWSIRWENRFKEALWLLSVNAGRHLGNSATRPQPAPQQQQQQQQQQLDGTQPDGEQPAPLGRGVCACGAGACSRVHHYHQCAVAAAVVAAIQAALPAACPPLQRRHIWLAEPPLPAVHPDLWLVISMAALTAMEHGRRRLCALHLQRRPAPPPAPLGGDGQQAPMRQLRITDFTVAGAGPTPVTVAARPPPPTPVEVAAAAACTEFWACLQSFAALGLRAQSARYRRRWVADVPDDHPLLRVDAATSSLTVVGGP